MDRRRLTSRLRARAEAKLTLVSAPAGFGKTTLLAAWLAAPAAEAAAVAWVSLDGGDNEPASSGPTWSPPCSAAGPGVGAGALALLRPAPAARDASWPPSINELGATPTDVELVLDDYHLDRRPATCTTGGLPARAPARPACTWSSAPGPTRRCRWRGCAPGASWSRSAPPTCASPPTEAAAYLNDVAGLELDASRRRGAGDAHRGLDRRPAARRAVAAGPRRRAGVHRRLRRRRPLRRGLPGRRGARRQPRRCATSCSRPPSSTGSSGPLCDAVTGEPGGQADARAARPRQPVPRPARRPAPLVPLPPPVRRRPAAPISTRAPRRGPEPAPARQRLVRRRPTSRSPPYGTPSPPRTSSGQPTSSRRRYRPSAGRGRRRRCEPGSTTFPTT